MILNCFSVAMDTPPPNKKLQYPPIPTLLCNYMRVPRHGEVLEIRRKCTDIVKCDVSVTRDHEGNQGD